MEKLTRVQFTVVVAVAAFVFAALGGGLAVDYSLSKRGETPGDSGFSIKNLISGDSQSAGDGFSSREEAVVAAVAKASPAVVAIVATKDVPVFEQFYSSPFGDDPFFRQFFGDSFQIPQRRQNGTEKREVSSGSGFIVSSNGLIVSNKHVVSDTAADYTAIMQNGKKYPAKVLARDPLQDLAVLKIEAAGLPTLKLSDSSAIKIGQTVIAIGNALGEFSNSVSVGVVSGLQRSITASGGGIGSEDLTELIQTDAAINPGNSGGPLLNIQGEVLGINTAIVQGAENIGFAIPVNKVRRNIESVEKTGRIVYPFLGVRYVTLNEEIKTKENLPVSEGALLKGDAQSSAVVAGSPADKAGLKDGDIVVEINGQKLDRDHLLASVIQQYKVGDTISVIYLRNGQRSSTSVTLTERGPN